MPIRLDVTDPESIAAAVRTVGERAGAAGFAGLVNNAGIAITGPLEFLPLDDIRRQFEVNVFGQIAVIQAFLPLLRAGHGRIINVGSVGARFALPFGGPLNASKAAFELLSDSLRLELRQWDIPVVLVSPGAIRTSAGSKLVRDSESTLQRLPPAGRSLYAAPYRGFVQALHGLEAHGAGPEVMASTVLRAMTARVPRRRYPVRTAVPTPSLSLRHASRGIGGPAAVQDLSCPATRGECSRVKATRPWRQLRPGATSHQSLVSTDRS